jgi:hypothetical protein
MSERKKERIDERNERWREGGREGKKKLDGWMEGRNDEGRLDFVYINHLVPIFLV